MLNRQIKRCLLSVSGLLLAVSSSLAWSQTPTVCTNVGGTTPDLTIAVASNFYEPAQQIASDFIAFYTPPIDTIRVCHNSTGNLVTEIKTGTSGYNLFLAADNDAPAALKATNPGLVVGNPFLYTQGIPLLWSNTIGVNISGGDVTNASVVSIALADPAKAPYGVAGQEILTSTGQWTTPVQTKIGTYFDNISLTQMAVQTGAKSAGYVAKSQVCRNGVVSGVSNYEYSPTTYSPVLQDGIVLNIASTTLTQSFVDYLLDTDAQDTLVNVFCYKAI